MKTSIIVQARMKSTRLPGKVLKRVLGKTLLEFQIERLLKVDNATDIIIATTVNPADDQIVKLCENSGINYFRGSEDNVLERYYLCAEKFNSDIIVRVTSDCPLIDYQIINKLISKFNENSKNIDYMSNTLQRTFPRGMDCEVFSFKILKEAHEQADDISEREHVTPFFYNHPERYRLKNLSNNIDLSRFRWTVDTCEDFELIKNILEAMYPVNPNYVMADIVDLIAKNPSWEKINAHINQKSIKK